MNICPNCLDTKTEKGVYGRRECQFCKPKPVKKTKNTQ
jgi:hypothetical protein